MAEAAARVGRRFGRQQGTEEGDIKYPINANCMGCLQYAPALHSALQSRIERIDAIKLQGCLRQAPALHSSTQPHRTSLKNRLSPPSEDAAWLSSSSTSPALTHTLRNMPSTNYARFTRQLGDKFACNKHTCNKQRSLKRRDKDMWVRSHGSAEPGRLAI